MIGSEIRLQKCKLIYGFVIHKRYKNVPTYDPNKLITKIRLQVNDSFLEIKQQKF